MLQHLGDTVVMKINCHASQDFASDATTVFALIVDADNFPSCFTGYGLIPAIRKIRLAEPLAVGVVRHIYNADNSVLTERVSILDKPHRHAYILSGFQPPFAWLVKQGDSDWKLKKIDTGTQVNWVYEFTLTSFLLCIPCFILLKYFMQRAMQACLENMDVFCNKNQKTD